MHMCYGSFHMRSSVNGIPRGHFLAASGPSNAFPANSASFPHWRELELRQVIAGSTPWTVFLLATNNRPDDQIRRSPIQAT